VQRHLRSRDAVSYLRFSSVFERFDVVDRFLHEIKSSLENG
jgi:transcriptional regulator NrdR family protein